VISGSNEIQNKSEPECIQEISFKEGLDRMITRYIIKQDCVDRVKSRE